MWDAVLGKYVADGRNTDPPMGGHATDPIREEFGRKYFEVFGALPGNDGHPEVVPKDVSPRGRPVVKNGDSTRNPVASQAIRPPVRVHSRRHGRNSTRRGGQRSTRPSSPKHRSRGRRRMARSRSLKRISRLASHNGRLRRGHSTHRNRSRHASPARRRALSHSRGSDHLRRDRPSSSERTDTLSLALQRDLAGKHAFRSPPSRISDQRHGHSRNADTIRSTRYVTWATERGTYPSHSLSRKLEHAAVTDWLTCVSH